jgi:predicted aldo/keto reductase-like oxidoreductase
MFRTARQVQDQLRCRGYARYVGISTHDRAVARELIVNDLLDVQMIRYNIAHRGAEPQFFDALPATGRQGVVAFNTTHNASGSLTRLPPGVAPTMYHPTHADLYKFALERPEVDVVLAGPKNRAEIDHALTALDDRPMNPRLYEYLTKLGHLHMGRATVGAPA